MRGNFDENKLKSIVGATIIKIEEFDNGTFDNGYLICFGNGLILTAQDGEYGENSFQFVDKEVYKKIKNKRDIT